MRSGIVEVQRSARVVLRRLKASMPKCEGDLLQTCISVARTLSRRPAEAEEPAKRLARQQRVAMDGHSAAFEEGWPVTWRMHQDDEFGEMPKEDKHRREAPVAL